MPRKQPKKRRGDGSSANACHRKRPEHYNHVWSYDFVTERLENNNQRVKLLVVIDEIASLIMGSGKDGTLAKLIGESTGQGRALGINLFLGTQQPNQKTMGAFTNADMHVRIVGKVNSLISETT